MDLQEISLAIQKNGTKRKLSKEQRQSPVIKNPYLAAANPFFLVASRLQTQVLDVAPSELHQRLMRIMQHFENYLEAKSFRAEQILLVRYFMAAMIDDIVAHVALKEPDLWWMFSLLMHYYNEKPGEEKIFLVLDRLMLEPEMNGEILEVAYYVLSYGYQGKYRFANNGRVSLLEKMDELYQLLHWQRGDFRKNLFVAQRHE